MKKRVTVTVDEEVLKDARIASGEKTDADAIRKALTEMVRQVRFRRALEKFEEEVAKGDFFWPNYIEEIRPNSRSVHFRKKRVAAHEKRAPRQKSRRVAR
jgi:hypothetical protein